MTTPGNLLRTLRQLDFYHALEIIHITSICYTWTAVHRRADNVGSSVDV